MLHGLPRGLKVGPYDIYIYMRVYIYTSISIYYVTTEDFRKNVTSRVSFFVLSRLAAHLNYTLVCRSIICSMKLDMNQKKQTAAAQSFAFLRQFLILSPP